MKRTVQVPLPPMGLTTVDPKSTTVGRRPIDRSISVDQARALLNRAIAECGYTLDALEAAMGKDRAYIHKVLQGDKPLPYAFIVALPDDVEAKFESLRAKSLGLIVAERVSGDQALEHLVSGLVGVLTKTA